MSVPEPSAFRISSYCNMTGCVGVATETDAVSVMSTLMADGPVLSFTPKRWTAFVEGVQSVTGDPSERWNR